MPLESYVDVLVIGAGPAGLMCANALAMVGVDVKIVDKRPTKVAAGQADGITPRTIEVLQSYGLAERLMREGNHIHIATWYHPSPEGEIKCTDRKPVFSSQSARYPFMIGLQQGAIEAIFLDSLRDHGVEVGRPMIPLDIVISEDLKELSSPLSHPVRVAIEHLDDVNDERKTEIVHAKFVVGADGAHSWVRKTLGIEMEGEQTDYIWGVVDVALETNFPDIRNIVGVQSSCGSCLMIPREDDKNRLYIQLSDTDLVSSITGKVDKSSMSPQKLLSVARKILYPYELSDPKYIEWWTIYTIGQRVASSYSVKDRIFIAGDACHTHSPKGGQGMNASMNDTHNLAWKFVHVLRGWSSPSLLRTYEHERRKYAQDLINFDKEFAALFSDKPRTAGNEDGVSPGELSRVLKTHAGFISGLGIQYSPSIIIDPTHHKCAPRLVIGQRMPPHIFIRAADIHPVDIQDLLPSDARFKVLFFVGNLTSTRVNELHSLVEELDRASSFLHKYGVGGSISTVFDIVTIIAGEKYNVDRLLVPAFLRPHWSKVLLDDTDATECQGGYAYERFGIDPNQITLVVVRPDGYVGTIAPSTAIVDLENYFGAFMVAHSSTDR